MTSFDELFGSLIRTAAEEDSRVVSLKLTNAICLSLVLSVAALRFWVRFVMLRSRGLDDLLLIVAIFFTVILSATSLICEKLGLGSYNLQLSSADPTEKLRVASNITKTLYGCYLAYPTAICFTKFSIMATYFRIFPPGHLRKCTVAISIATLLFWVASIFAIVFTCVPVQAAWDYKVKGRCYNLINIFTMTSSFHILLDILLCILPVPIIWSLSMPKTQRLILLALFCGGALACISSILRLIHLWQTIDNISVNTISAVEWSIIEVNTGIFCAAVAALRPLCRLITIPYTSYIFKSTDTITHDLKNDAQWQNRRLLSSNKMPELGHNITRVDTAENPQKCAHVPEITRPRKSVLQAETRVNIGEVQVLKAHIDLSEVSSSKSTCSKTSENRKSTLEVPSPVTRKNCRKQFELASAEVTTDAAYQFNNRSQQDNIRRKTWNNSHCTSVISPEQKCQPWPLPPRRHSVYINSRHCYPPNATKSSVEENPAMNSVIETGTSLDTFPILKRQTSVFLFDDSDEEPVSNSDAEMS